MGQIYMIQMALYTWCFFLVVSDSATPRTVARQAPQSMGFPRQEYWRGLPFVSPMGWGIWCKREMTFMHRQQCLLTDLLENPGEAAANSVCNEIQLEEGGSLMIALWQHKQQWFPSCSHNKTLWGTERAVRPYIIPAFNQICFIGPFLWGYWIS